LTTDLRRPDPPDYRTVLGRVPTSVAVIATMGADGPAGVSVGSFTSVSLDPPLVGFFISRTSTTWPRIRAGGGFCVSILGSRQEELSRTFASPGADRFGACSWRSSPSGWPMIDGAAAWIDCVLHSTAPAGDHDLVLGQVTGLDAPEVGAPLVFLGGRYGRIDGLGQPGEEW